MRSFYSTQQRNLWRKFLGRMRSRLSCSSWTDWPWMRLGPPERRPLKLYADLFNIGGLSWTVWTLTLQSMFVACWWTIVSLDLDDKASAENLWNALGQPFRWQTMLPLSNLLLEILQKISGNINRSKHELFLYDTVVDHSRNANGPMLLRRR